MINTWGTFVCQHQRRNQATQSSSATFGVCHYATSNGQETLLQASKPPSFLTTLATHHAQPTSHWSKVKHSVPFAIFLLWLHSWCASACGFIAALQNPLGNVFFVLRNWEVKVLIFLQAKSLILSAFIDSNVFRSLVFFFYWLRESLLFPISFLYSFT